ncbi:MAG: DUF177 domain-containing protein, partial [Candidatus Marinimicrobia bacterium]|nr:DUF177 domain-containing protein [Candidatus Neomarinimicrobiota bacterium]MCF7839421.1 DUF177 domain-containing protein [Candidatus Neomarinimicrobiota bacterium]
TRETLPSILARFDMKVLLHNLPQGKSKQIFDSLAPLTSIPDLDWTPKSLSTEIEIDNQTPVYYCKLTATCNGIFTCEVGLEKFEDTLTGVFEFTIRPLDRHFEETDEEDIYFTSPGQSEFEIDEIIRDTVLLAIPISHRCSDNCPEGRKLQELIEPEEEMDERWEKLKNIFKEKG